MIAAVAIDIPFAFVKGNNLSLKLAVSISFSPSDSELVRRFCLKLFFFSSRFAKLESD